MTTPRSKSDELVVGTFQNEHGERYRVSQGTGKSIGKWFLAGDETEWERLELEVGWLVVARRSNGQPFLLTAAEWSAVLGMVACPVGGALQEIRSALHTLTLIGEGRFVPPERALPALRAAHRLVGDGKAHDEVHEWVRIAVHDGHMSDSDVHMVLGEEEL